LILKQTIFRNKDDVFNLLLTSERVYTDLIEAVDAHVLLENDQWATSIILRRWLDNLWQHAEFRVFVYQRRVVAISQYNHLCRFKQLSDNASRDTELQLIALIQPFVEKTVMPKLDAEKFDNAIVDVALLPTNMRSIDDDNDNEIGSLYNYNLEPIVIELNPFATTTGPALFDWTVDKDILMPTSTAKSSSSSSSSSNEVPIIRIHYDIPPNVDSTLDAILSDAELMISLFVCVSLFV
jgi:hypothetical protein